MDKNETGSLAMLILTLIILCGIMYDHYHQHIEVLIGSNTKVVEYEGEIYELVPLTASIPFGEIDG